MDIPSEAVTDHRGNAHFFHTRKNPVSDVKGESARLVALAPGRSRTPAGWRPVTRLREQGPASTRNVRALVHSMSAPAFHVRPGRHARLTGETILDDGDDARRREYDAYLVEQLFPTDQVLRRAIAPA